jgi:drug/metabolite transporter (DMT)-like permease
MKQSNKRALIFMLLISTMLGAAGQLLFKMGVTSDLGGLVTFIMVGVSAYLVSTLIYFYVLSRTHLSWAYGFTGLSYIFASVVAFLFLGEQIPILRWIGIFVIAVGTLLIGTS